MDDLPMRSAVRLRAVPRQGHLILECDLPLCIPALKSTVNLSASFSHRSSPANKKKYIIANRRSLDIGGVKYMLENNAMPVILRMRLSSEED